MRKADPQRSSDRYQWLFDWIWGSAAGYMQKLQQGTAAEGALALASVPASAAAAAALVEAQRLDNGRTFHHPILHAQARL
jgi:hypothetical protein